jgi:hypothetical protein
MQASTFVKLSGAQGPFQCSYLDSGSLHGRLVTNSLLVGLLTKLYTLRVKFGVRSSCKSSCKGQHPIIPCKIFKLVIEKVLGNHFHD